MEKSFKSKLGPEIVILLLSGGIIMILAGNWLGVALFRLVYLFFFYLYFSTTYKFTADNNLLIKSGFLINIKFSVSSIKSVKATKNPMASPALSFDRLQIDYNNHQSVIISPKQKQLFIKVLKEMNKEIIFQQ